ncbi:Na/Pi symporter [Allofustis seminis]|uniref:Na/Pi cotransporter family protein n=1 Tax=Allofustis seminis TaxID=166939 RepID=UPI0003658E50
MDMQAMLFQFVGGLGIFLFGISLMGDGLKLTAGDSLRELLQRFTSTPFKAVLTGVVVTSLIQSSSGTTVLAVGLVSSGFMTLQQAIGVVMGANIGTTVTSFIIGINLGQYALPIIGAGSILMFFFKNPQIKHIGQVIIGFGMLFYGLELMGTGMEPLQEVQAFHDLMARLSTNPVLGVGVGTVLTMVMQSSSATIGILQQLYAQGSITLGGLLPVLFGNNIGTTITALLATVGANVAARQTAGAHVFFNVMGTIFSIILLHPFTLIITYATDSLGLAPAMQIAFAHGLFNILNVIILFWFIPQIARLMEKLMPDKQVEEEAPTHLDVQVLRNAGPTLALHQAHKALIQLALIVQEQFDLAALYYHEKDEKYVKQIHILENEINQKDIHLTDYLGLISEYELGQSDTEVLSAMINTSKYLERIGDHTTQITDNLTEAVHIEKHRIEEGKANTDGRKMQWGDSKLERMFLLAQENVAGIVHLIDLGDRSVVSDILEREAEIDALQEKLRTRYINLIRSGKSCPTDNILFIDIVASLERIGDHTRKLVTNHLNFLYHYSPQDIIEESELSVTPKVDQPAN